MQSKIEKRAMDRERIFKDSIQRKASSGNEEEVAELDDAAQEWAVHVIKKLKSD